MNIVLPALLTVVTMLYFLGAGLTNTIYIAFVAINSYITLSVMFSQENRPFTLQKMVNLFCYVFFIVANGVQYASKATVLTFHCYLTDLDFVSFQAILLCILFLFNWTYTLVLSGNENKLRAVKYYREPRPTIYTNRLIWIALFGSLVFFAYMHFSISRMIFRGVEESGSGVASHVNGAMQNTSSRLIFTNIVRPLAFCGFVLALLYKVSRRKLIPLFALTLFSVCPTGLARNATAMFWLPIVIIIYGHKFRNHIFMWLMIVAIFVLFPFWNIFRNFNGTLQWSWSLDELNTLSYDASQIFMATVKTNFITYGNQLLGVLFFFVPRSIWLDKPVGSGATLVDAHHGFFNNISMPYFSEGYVNFGFIGILIFTLFLAYLYAKLDALYWNKWKRQRSYKCAYYLILLGATIFIMRGDLLSSFAYTVGIMLSYTMCLWLCTSVKFTNLRWK